MSATVRAAAVMIALVSCLVAASDARAGEETSCTVCHADTDLFDEATAAIVKLEEGGVHAVAGVSCHDCHGGNPDPALADDPLAAMDEGYAADPYRGRPARADIPAACGSCHADPERMRAFGSDLPTSQLAEYWRSRHGVRLAAGDADVATCVDCHGAHGIRGADDPAAPVHPTRVAATCGRCHADAERMGRHRRADGSPYSIDVEARWRASVHARGMYERGDLSAPTCNDCHGAHGPAPEGLDSAVDSCSQCHSRETRLFAASAKAEGFAEHEELLLPEAGEEGCAACHTPPEPAARFVGRRSLGRCAACHGPHDVVRPGIVMLARTPRAPCYVCHDASGEGGVAPLDRPGAVERFAALRDELLAEGAERGLEGEALFDWLVEKIPQLPPHTDVVVESGQQRRVPRPEFSRLFEKARLEPIHYTFSDPERGIEGVGRRVNCRDCHDGEGDTPGSVTAREMARRIRELSLAVARAERLFLAARRGGVEVRPALEPLEQAVQAEVELEALVHTFSVEEGGAFDEKHREGMDRAEAALAAGRAALDELRARRRGLIVSLVFIAMLLVGLALKIRQLERRRLAAPRDPAG